MSRPAHGATAGPFIRLLANLLDGLILLIPVTIVNGGSENPSMMGLCGGILMVAAYYTLFTASPWQATPGKRLLNIYVVRRDGRPLSRRDGLERFLAYFLPTLPFYSSLPENMAILLGMWLHVAWFAPILLREDRRGIHDHLCATRVLEGRLEGE